MQFTKTFYELVKYKDIPIKIVVGGTRSGKTVAILQYLWIKFEKYKELTSVVSESMPHMKKGAFRDFVNILKSEGIELDRENFNKSDYVYKEGLEFFGLDSSEKAHGPARVNLFVNEIQNNKYETVFQLMQRTEGETILDFNPTGDFWIYENIIENPEFKEGIDYVIIHSTIKDNPYISDNIKRLVYARAEIDENYKKVYLLGEKGVLEGLIFDGINYIDEMPKQVKWKAYGLDFGFVNDPTAIIQVSFVNGELYLDEKVYETGLLNVPNPSNKPSIVERLQENDIFKQDTIIADSAEFKSIAEIMGYGYFIKGVKKPQNSIKQGIDILKRYKINITKQSVNLIKEFRNYKWKIDRDNNALNVPVDNYNHGIDAVRYIAFTKLNTINSAQLRGLR